MELVAAEVGGVGATSPAGVVLAAALAGAAARAALGSAAPLVFIRRRRLCPGLAGRSLSDDPAGPGCHVISRGDILGRGIPFPFLSRSVPQHHPPEGAASP